MSGARVAGSVTGVELYQAMEPGPAAPGDAPLPASSSSSNSVAANHEGDGNAGSDDDDDDDGNEFGDDVTELDGLADASLSVYACAAPGKSPGKRHGVPAPPQGHAGGSLTPTGRGVATAHRWGGARDRFPATDDSDEDRSERRRFETRKRFASAGSATAPSQARRKGSPLRDVRPPSDRDLAGMEGSGRGRRRRGRYVTEVAETSRGSSPSAGSGDNGASAAAIAVSRPGAVTPPSRAGSGLGDDDGSSTGGGLSHGGGRGDAGASGESLPFDLPVRLLMRSVIERLDDLEAGQSDAARMLESVTDRLAMIAETLAAVDQRHESSTSRVARHVRALTVQVADAAQATRLALGALSVASTATSSLASTTMTASAGASDDAQ